MALATSVLFAFPRVGFMFYFLPSIVAFARGKRDLLTDLPTQCFPQDINRLGCRFDLGSKGGRARRARCTRSQDSPISASDSAGLGRPTPAAPMPIATGESEDAAAGSGTAPAPRLRS